MRRRLSTPRISPGQIAIWTPATGNATLCGRAGEIGDSYHRSFETPAAIALGACRDVDPCDHAEIDRMGTVAGKGTQPAADQRKLIGRALANGADER